MGFEEAFLFIKNLEDEQQEYQNGSQMIKHSSAADAVCVLSVFRRGGLLRRVMSRVNV